MGNFITQVKPQDAISNTAAWVKSEFGYAPAWLDSNNTDAIVRLLSDLALLTALIWFFWPQLESGWKKIKSQWRKIKKLPPPISETGKWYGNKFVLNTALKKCKIFHFPVRDLLCFRAISTKICAKAAVGNGLA